MDARIDAATVEYTEILMNIENIDFREIEKRIADAKRGGFPPTPKWREGYRNPPEDLSMKSTVADVPEARGNFTW